MLSRAIESGDFRIVGVLCDGIQILDKLYKQYFFTYEKIEKSEYFRGIAAVHHQNDQAP